MRRRRVVALALLALLMAGPIASAAVTYGSVKQTNAGSNVPSKAIDAPSGLAAGDVMLAQIVAERGNGVTITPPAGWTLVDRVNRSVDLTQAIYLRVAGSSEPASYTFAFNPTTRMSGSIVRFKDADPGFPVEAVSRTDTSGISVTMPSVNASGDGRMLVLFAGAGVKTSWTSQAGMTEVSDKANRVSSTASYQAVNVGATGPRTATGKVTDDYVGHLVLLRPVLPPTVAFNVTASAVSESAGSATLAVSLSKASASSVSVSYAVTGGTASAGTDYTLAPGTLTFAPGQTTRSLTIPIVNDAAREANETVVVALSAPVNADLGGVGTHTLTLVDDDPVPTVAFVTSSTSGLEGGGDVLVPVRLSQPTFETVVVSFAPTGGSAMQGLDYTVSGTTLTFAPGATMRNITLTIQEDALYETTENILLALSAPVNATLGSPGTHERLVLDNDVAPSVRFAESDATVPEGEPATLTVVLSSASGVAATVAYTTVDGTAGAGDYVTTQGTLDFAPGVTSRTISIPTLEDGTFEGDEAFSVHLSNATNASLSTPSLSNVSILDAQAPVSVRFQNLTSTVSETAGPAPIRVLLSGRAEGPVTVGYRLFGATATRDSDYTLDDGTLTFAPGVTSMDLPFVVLDDELVEDDETVTFELHDPTGGALLGNATRHTRTIQSDDLPPPVVGFANAAATSPEDGGTASLRVTLSRAVAFATHVDFATGGGTATPGSDYGPTSGTLTFMPGETQVFLPVDIFDDDENEGDETFHVTLSNPRNATLGTALQVRTILDNDLPPPTVAFLLATSSVSEALEQVRVEVALSRAHTRPVEVSFSTADGSARAPTDYVSQAGRLVIPPGQTRGFIALAIADDDVIELDETFSVTLSDPANATLAAPTTHTVTIANDDTAPLTVEFSTSTSTGGEDSPIATLTVVLNAATEDDVDVDYAVTGGTATNGVDYVLSPGTLVIPAGATSRTISITILEDTAYEGDETIVITLSSPVNAALGARSQHTRVILDNDAAPTQIISVNPTPVRWDGSPDTGASWGGWSAEAGARNVSGTNYLKLVNVGTLPNPSVVVGFSENAFRGVNDTTFTIPIAANLQFAWWEDTTPGASAPSEGTYSWIEGGAAGSTTVRFTGSGNILYVVYRVKEMPDVLPVQSYAASFTVTEV